MRIQRLSKKQQLFEDNNPIDIELLLPVIEQYKGKKGALIPLLQKTQDIYGYLPRYAFEKISEETGFHLSNMYGVATFYAQFRLAPVGKYVIKVCHGTACHVQNAKSISNALKEELKIGDGETSEDRLFTLETVACLGCCSLAPVMMIGNETYGKLTGKSAVKVIKKIKKEAK